MNAAPVALVAALSFASFLPFCGGIDRPSIDEVSSDSVTYQTEDGVQIVASWFRPPDEAKPPVVILLHEQDGTRAQWDPLIPILVKNEGYAVLAPDLRGHGESDTIIREGKEEPYKFSNPQDAMLDVLAALTWLQGRSDVDLNRTGVIGARLGADLAYVSSGTFAPVRAAVAITPDPFLPDNANYPLLATIPDFAAHDVFIMAGGRRQWEEAVTLGIRITFPEGRRYIDTPDLDGVALLANDDMIKDTLEFFEQRVKSPLATASPAPLATASPAP